MWTACRTLAVWPTSPRGTGCGPWDLRASDLRLWSHTRKPWSCCKRGESNSYRCVDVIDTVCFPSLSAFEPPPFSPGSRGALQKERHVSPSFPAASLAKRDRTFVVLRMGRRSYGRGRVCVRGCLTRLLELPCPLCAMQPPNAGCMPGSGDLTGAARRAGRQPSRCANSSHGPRPHSRCGHATKNVTGARSTGARSDGSFFVYCWFPWVAFMACSIFSFRSPTLKLAPACIGGYSTKLGRYFSITCAEIW